MTLKLKNKIIIGIDPDVDESGVAVVDCREIIGKWYKVEFLMLDYESLRVFLQQKHIGDCNVVIVVEKGEENTPLFNAVNAGVAMFMKYKSYPSPARVRKALKVAAKVGMSTGKNFQVTEMIAGFLDSLKIPYKIYVPHSAKWSAKYIKSLFGITGRTNPEKRDALRAAAGYV